MTNLSLSEFLSLLNIRHPTDAEVLGDLIQDCDREQDFVSGSNNYVWWHQLARLYMPKRILEIGTRYGYSAWAAMQGSCYPLEMQSLTVYDAETDGEKTLHIMEQWFRCHGIGELTIHQIDTQKLQSLYPMELVDWATVDADHTKAGAYHDCELAWPWVKSGGVMVVDDTIEGGEVRAGVEEWALERGLKWQYIPSLRGIHVFEKK